MHKDTEWQLSFILSQWNIVFKIIDKMYQSNQGFQDEIANYNFF